MTQKVSSRLAVVRHVVTNVARMIRRLLPSSSRFPRQHQLFLPSKDTVGRRRIRGTLNSNPSWKQPLSVQPQFCFSTTQAFRLFSSSLASDETDDHHDDIVTEDELTVEEQYSRKTPVEHVLLRPGMYVGPVERLPPTPCWVLEETNDMQHMVQKDLSLVPALIKVFDEILVNASDNRLRHPKSCTRIEVDIHPGSKTDPPLIRVYNNGKGIPIQVHRKEQLHVPEMLFGHLLTGSNFDDDAKRVTGGRHGYGAKLTNIFSKSFTVETADSRKGLRYKQTWQNNMTTSTQPEITPLPEEQEDYTCVSFVPDLEKLTGDPTAVSISPQDYAVMCRRVLDVAGCAGDKLQVTLNGKDVSFQGFEQYTQLYRSPEAPPMCFYKSSARWHVGVGLSSNNSFQSISFVNGMATTRGGTHVNVIVQQISKAVAEKVAKLHPELADTVNLGLIRRHLFVAANTLIENPTFDSQMKESLTSNPNSFGTSYTLPEKFLKQVVLAEEDGGPGIVEEVVRVAQGRQQANLLKQVGGTKKTRRQLLSIPKLEDAHMAGTATGCDCTLILTEGDSAKALAVAGLEVIGRDLYGVFPLRGKFLNVRDASVVQLTNNAEVKALCSILGLDFDVEYETQSERNRLRYGHVMLMTDQDTDGSHIKGLVMNFFRHFWPKLLKPPIDHLQEKPFLSSFITPLLKATKKGKKSESKSFYSMVEYNEWRDSLEKSGEDIKKWKVKYYKGLGTSTPAEAKEYFKSFSDHHLPFHWNSEADGELLDMAFDKKRASDRRNWILEEYDEESSVTADPNLHNAVTFEDFVNNEMIHFSHADNVRSLPSVIDGLKPSQRKVLYACFKRNLKSEIKVAQLTGYCAEHTAYHHGEASLHSTIIGMAQDFVGSNNINLLEPIGQFGTRFTGGKDAASPRYIFTCLSPVARLLFPEADDVLLTHREDDGQLIEPEFYCPIIPLLLVNGSQGIGTGWSTFVPPHNPHDVLSYVRAKLDCLDDLPPIHPWVRGFDGSIRVKDDGRGYITRGSAEPSTQKSLTISELPVGRWTNDYKTHLLRMCGRAEIQSFVENHTTTSVSFTVKANSASLARMIKSGVEKKFKLETSLPTTNMHAFDENHSIQKYLSAQDIADAYFPTRLALYHDRKSVLESEMNYTATMLRSKARFVSSVTDGRIELVRGTKTKEETVADLKELSFPTASELQTIRSNNAVASRTKDDSSDEHVVERYAKEFDYLLNMPLSSLTANKIQDLHSEAAKTEKDLEEIQATSPDDLWRADLDKLEPHLPNK